VAYEKTVALTKLREADRKTEFESLNRTSCILRLIAAASSHGDLASNEDKEHIAECYAAKVTIPDWLVLVYNKAPDELPCPDLPALPCSKDFIAKEYGGLDTGCQAKECTNTCDITTTAPSVLTRVPKPVPKPVPTPVPTAVPTPLPTPIPSNNKEHSSSNNENKTNATSPNEGANRRCVEKSLFSNGIRQFYVRFFLATKLNSMKIKKVHGGSCHWARTFGFNGTKAWVKDGCKADFIICFNYDPERRCVAKRLLSPNNGQYNWIPTKYAKKVTSMYIRKWHAGKCRWAETYGYDGKKAWVKNGCKADFNICYT